MNAEKLRQHIENADDITILDVREADEFESTQTIPGAQNMPMGKVFVEAKKGNLPKDKKIVTVCKVGGRCEIIARELSQKGFDIEALEGGLEAWNA
tara:strand:+ start:6497 stop:6784 length:288 start_codon:yes stop_codon:yes gene_type:complete